MMLVKQYHLPAIRNGYSQVKAIRDDLMSRFRTGKFLAPEEKDWLDWADIALDKTEDFEE